MQAALELLHSPFLGTAVWIWLVFIGVVIALLALVGIIGKIPPTVSLGVTFALIAGGVLFSLWKTRSAEPALNAR
jgi:tellurite resistance protein TerC